MALSMLVRPQTTNRVASLLSNVAKFSTRTSTPVKMLENRNATILLTKQCFGVQPVTKNVRNFTLTLPKQSAAGADHSKLWTAEKVVSLVILGVLPAAILVPCRPLDTILAISLVMHSHWGIEALITDYVRESMFGTVVPKLTHGTMILISATVLGGLLYFIYADVGLGQAVRKLWTIKAQ